MSPIAKLLMNWKGELWFAFQITNKSPALSCRSSSGVQCKPFLPFMLHRSVCSSASVYTYNRPNSYAPLYTERERETICAKLELSYVYSIWNNTTERERAEAIAPCDLIERARARGRMNLLLLFFPHSFHPTKSTCRTECAGDGRHEYMSPHTPPRLHIYLSSRVHSTEDKLNAVTRHRSAFEVSIYLPVIITLALVPE
jgi:hypothetical protein